MLENKIALVTGASRGIGREIALSLAKEGAFVIVNYNGSRERAEEVVREIEEAGHKGVSCQCDVADNEACEAMIKALIKEYGRVDILVMKMSEEEFDEVVATNLKGTFHTIRHLSRYFLKQRAGKIINISSVSGLMGNAGQANYSASKAGVIGLTKSVARELASRGINVNAVAPGMIDTEMTEVLSEEVKEQMLCNIPLKRIGTTKNIADAVVFLASDRSDYITGQVLVVDGGMTM